MIHPEHDKELIRQLYAARKPVMAWIRNNSGSTEDAEDIIQEAIIICVKLSVQEAYAGTLKNPGSLLFAVARKAWLNQLRKNKRMPETAMPQEMPLPGMEEIDMLMEKEERLKSLEQALLQLGEKCRQLLELFYFHKMDMVSIAEKLGFRNDKVAKAMKYKCLEHGRELIKKQSK